MRKGNVAKDVCQIVMIVLLLGAILANIKSVFADFDIDSEYAMAMSYRMLQGDHMFSQMWEPHQTSAFLCTFLMGIYVKLMGCTTGSALFLQISGLLIHCVIAFAVYNFFKRHIDTRLAQLISLFFFVVRPKDIVFPEFSNMQMWFSVLLFLCLILYFESCRKRWLVMASISLCLEIISYPSCLIVYFFVLLLLWLYGKHRAWDMILFSAGCAIQGIMYICFFVSRLGLDNFLDCIGKIVAADSSHGGGRTNFFVFLGISLVEIGICLAITILITVIARKCMSGNQLIKKHNFLQCAVLIFAGCYTIIDCLNVLIFRDKFSYITLFIFFIMGIFGGMKHCTAEEKRIVVVGTILSIGSFFAVLLLTNLDILSIVKYLILAVMVSFIPLSRIFDRNIHSKNLLFRWFVLFCFCAVIIFRRDVVIKPLSGAPRNLYDVRGVVKTGPAIGIFSDYMGAYIENCTREEWSSFVKEGDRILLVGESTVMTMPYLYEKVSISAASTICTPTYDEMLLEYWDKNPQKKPTLIMVDCWYGKLHVSEDSWIMQWINEEFQPSTYSDGKYWRYYRLIEDED